MEHLPGNYTAFVAGLAGLWNICRRFINFCVFFIIAVKMYYFSQNFIFLRRGGGIGVGVLYTVCLNAPVSRVARKFRMLLANCVSIFMHDSYLCMLMQ